MRNVVISDGQPVVGPQDSAGILEGQAGVDEPVVGFQEGDVDLGDDLVFVVAVLNQDRGTGSVAGRSRTPFGLASCNLNLSPSYSCGSPDGPSPYTESRSNANVRRLISVVGSTGRWVVDWCPRSGRGLGIGRSR